MSYAAGKSTPCLREAEQAAEVEARHIGNGNVGEALPGTALGIDIFDVFGAVLPDPGTARLLVKE